MRVAAGRARGLVLIAAFAATGVAHAEEAGWEATVYRARTGDTFELIAAEFYGDRSKASFIVAANKVTRPRPVRPGERLRVPVVREVATSPGDTFESLAALYLGSARRSGFLADYNAIPVESDLPAGTVIAIPVAVPHTAPAIESMGEISRLFFGDGKSAELIKRYNFLERPTIEKADAVMVPALALRMNPGRVVALDPDAKARRDRRRGAVAKLARALPAARVAWKAGEFAAVKAELGPLEPELDYLDASEAVELAVLLGSARLAFDEQDGAIAAFRRAIDRQPQRALSRYHHSPKVLAAWVKAGGKIGT